MEDLLALFEAEPAVEQCVPTESSSSEPTESDLRIEKHQRLTDNVDEKIGVRMTKRIVSSDELLSMISERPFVPVASLSASSLASLNRLLVEPAAVLDASTVAGRTEMITAGVVFTSTGSRVSSNGHAFNILTIGSMHSGPCVTVLLFGGAYSKLTKQSLVGKVIAITCPKICPPKNDSKRSSDTSITISASDERQLTLVAEARDFGMCQARVKGKNEQGQWITNHKACKNHIDKRLGNFCAVHKSQGNAKNTGTQMTQLRQEHSMFSSTTRKVMTMPMSRQMSQQPQHQQQHQPLLTNRQLNPYATNNTNSLLASRNSSAAVAGRSQPTTPLLSQRMNQTKVMQAQPAQRMTPGNIDRGLVGNKRRQPSSQTTAIPKKQRTPLSAQDIINGRAVPKKKYTKSINTVAVGGFDGSVAVPRPSKLFMPTTTVKAAPQRMSEEELEAKREEERNAILYKQRLAAQMLKAQNNDTNNNENKKPLLVKTKNTKKDAKPENKVDSFYDKLDIDTSNIANAKSKFADNVNAEEFARSRLAVVELEKLEEKKTDKKQERIKKEWYCKSCKRSMVYEPKHCLRAGHIVTVKRSMVQDKSIDQVRADMSEKKDGGLTLGSGLEWSRWNRFG